MMPANAHKARTHTNNTGKQAAGTCSMMPANAHRRGMRSGTPTASSWKTALTKKTSTVAQ